MNKKILFITGSMNQTSQMHQIASHIKHADCYFSQFYSTNPLANSAKQWGWFDNTIMGGKFQYESEAFLHREGVNMDYQAKKNTYDLVVLCTDMYIPGNLKGVKKLWVQEGMIDNITTLGKIVKKLKLPRYMALNTALNGSSNQCDIFCTASEGYREHLINMGTDPHKIITTGIPNYDNVAAFLNNDFPHRNFILVTTSDIRELMGVEDRPAFLKECVKIAKGRKLIFKLHPNELEERAIQEIKENTPSDTLVFTKGNVNHMIANCQELITQYSTLVYVGLSLDKKCYSYFDMDTLKRLTPLQNGGTSAAHIASIATQFVNFTGSPKDFLLNKMWLKQRENIVSRKLFETA